MPADTRPFNVFFECTSSCLLLHPSLSSGVFWHPAQCCLSGSLSLQSGDVVNHCHSPWINNVLRSLHASPSHHLIMHIAYMFMPIQFFLYSLYMPNIFVNLSELVPDKYKSTLFVQQALMLRHRVGGPNRPWPVRSRFRRTQQCR